MALPVDTLKIFTFREKFHEMTVLPIESNFFATRCAYSL